LIDATSNFKANSRDSPSNSVHSKNSGYYQSEVTCHLHDSHNVASQKSYQTIDSPVRHTLVHLGEVEQFAANQKANVAPLRRCSPSAREWRWASFRSVFSLAGAFPEDTFVKFTYVPVLRALAALGRGKPADSADRLEIARQYELAANGLNSQFYLGGLHSAYVRGEAFIAARRYAEAAAEFQKILDHRGIVRLDPIGVLAHLELGRVFALSGDKAKAKAAYEAFLALWKDADADVPILKRAKTEYARL